MDSLFKEMQDAVIEGDEDLCVSLAEKAIEQKIDPQEAISNGYGKGMEILGDMFERKEVFLPEILFAADAMQAAVDILKPLIEETGTGEQEKRGKVVIGTIQGDVHDIGKNIVALFLSVSGFEVIDLGRDVPVRNLISTAEKEGADIVAASALMTTTMIYMPELLKQLNEMGIRDKYKVIFGGAPVIKSWVDEIGADGYGLTAKEAVDVAVNLVTRH